MEADTGLYCPSAAPRKGLYGCGRAVPVRRSGPPERHRTQVRLDRFVFVLTLLVDLLLATRLSLKLIMENPGSLVAGFMDSIRIDFARTIYTMTGPLMTPIWLLSDPPAAIGSELEITVRSAMPVYALPG